ncbi:MAG: hypothetical protein IKD19_02430 [Prevotella sp.]|nr:hypothetical protein [Prevotella sp.]MBR7171050.1 hypothetical protein [Prevotella sp.]
MKKKFLLLLFMNMSLIMHAEESCLVIKQKSGAETIFPLYSNPVITFEKETMVVTNDFTSMFIPIDDIDNYEMKPNTTKIEGVLDRPQFVNGHVLFPKVPKEACAFVYTLDGKLVEKHQANSENIIDINMCDLPSDTYIIGTRNIKFKVIINNTYWRN